MSWVAYPFPEPFMEAIMLETPALIDVAEMVRISHGATFGRQINTATSLKIAQEIINDEEADAYIIMFALGARKYNNAPHITWLATLPFKT